MTNLRQLAEKDLKTTLESDWKLPVILISPDGIRQTKSKNDPEEDLGGQVMYETLEIDVETGLPMVSDEPVVSLRVSSLDKVPLPNEKWAVLMPTSPVEGAPMEEFVLQKPIVGSYSLGFIRLHLTRVTQS